MPQLAAPRLSWPMSVKRPAGNSAGTRPMKSKTFTHRSLATQQVATPMPARPDIAGSTTPSVAPTAAAASKAFPPNASICAPAAAAKGWAAATIPWSERTVGR